MALTDVIHTEIPGTIFLIDINHDIESIAHNGKGDILLIPQPSSSPRDPLNWQRYKKLYTLSLCALYACVMGFGENILGAAWTQVGEETNVTLTNMNGASALNWLLLGFANLVWIPTAMKIGRKFVYITSLIIMVVMYSWSAVFTGTGQWYGACALGGLGTSAYQALIQLTIMDVFFVHERGTMLAFYLWAQQLGAILGLILGGYIAEGPGWRWGENICAILCAFVAVLIFFTMDDSMYPRASLPDNGLSAQPAGAVADSPLPGASTSTNSRGLVKQDSKARNVSIDQVTITDGSVIIPTRTYIQLLCPVHYFKDDKTTFYQYFRRPFVLFGFPNIVVSGLIFAFGGTAGMASFSTIAEIMTAPPYNWTTGPTGLMYLAGLVGSFVGMATGFFGDRLVIFLARKNDGYKEPEMRLWMLCFSFCYAAAGYMTYGWAAESGSPWIAVAVGLGCMIAHGVSAASIATAYAMECFEGIAGELVVVLAICSSVINFAVSYSVQPLIIVMGVGWTFTFYGLLVLISILGAIPMFIWGKEWRKKAAPRYYDFMEETGRR